jgi:hypothetical protein
MTTHILGGVLSFLSFVFKRQLGVVAIPAYRSSQVVLAGSTPNFILYEDFSRRCARLVIRVGHERICES